MTLPLVSVLIPCFNAEQYIGAALDSVLGQTWKHIEVIVVDDGSTDGSVREFQRFSDTRVRLLSQTNAGASAARNAAFAACHGDFIQFLDADDVLHSNKIKVQIERLASAPPGHVASGSWARFSNQTSEATFRPEAVWRDLSPVEFLTASWLGGGMMAPCVWLTPRPILECAGAWNEKLSLNDDGEFFTRVVLASSGVLFCQGAKSYYRTTASPSLSKRKDSAALVSAFQAAQLCAQALLKASNGAETRKACCYLFQRFVHDIYPRMPHLTKAAEIRASELGEWELPVAGGPLFNLVSRVCGWKVARRLQILAEHIDRAPGIVGRVLHRGRRT
jgi:glycosyltransferase involved in cell wall biosynthesis